MLEVDLVSRRGPFKGAASDFPTVCAQKPASGRYPAMTPVEQEDAITGQPDQPRQSDESPSTERQNSEKKEKKKRTFQVPRPLLLEDPEAEKLREIEKCGKLRKVPLLNGCPWDAYEYDSQGSDSCRVCERELGSFANIDRMLDRATHTDDAEQNFRAEMEATRTIFGRLYECDLAQLCQECVEVVRVFMVTQESEREALGGIYTYQLLQRLGAESELDGSAMGTKGNSTGTRNIAKRLPNMAAAHRSKEEAKERLVESYLDELGQVLRLYDWLKSESAWTLSSDISDVEWEDDVQLSGKENVHSWPSVSVGLLTPGDKPLKKDEKERKKKHRRHSDHTIHRAAIMPDLIFK